MTTYLKPEIQLTAAQAAFAQSTAQFNLFVGDRRTGKTTALVAVLQYLQTERFVWVTPNFTQTRIVKRFLAGGLPETAVITSSEHREFWKELWHSEIRPSVILLDNLDLHATLLLPFSDEGVRVFATADFGITPRSPEPSWMLKPACAQYLANSPDIFYSDMPAPESIQQHRNALAGGTDVPTPRPLRLVDLA